MMENYQKSEYELLREKNIRELQEYMRSEENLELVEALNIISEYSQSLKENRIQKVRKKPTKGDPSFRFKGAIPKERRRSSRLANIDPQNLVDEKALSEDSEIDEIENIYSKRRVKRPRQQIVVTEYRESHVTARDFENIAKHVSEKVYNSNGSTCHQCRQKTLDTKSFCHNTDCTGMQGQICGPCLLNRYGENVADTLRDPFWICPFCRNECNCSFCRIREGKQPTGILTPTALGHGFNSVLDYLKSREGGKQQKPNVNSITNFIKEILTKIQDRVFNKYTPVVTMETEKGTKLLLIPEIQGAVAEKKAKKSKDIIDLSENEANISQTQLTVVCNDAVIINGQEIFHIKDIIDQLSTHELPFIGYFPM